MKPPPNNAFSPVFHRAFLFGLALIAGSSVLGQPPFRPAPRYTEGGKADQTEGAKILAEFQRAVIAGTYWLAFDLQVLPRRGAERTIKGEMLGTPDPRGPLTRVAIGGQRWLIQSGRDATTWTMAPNDAAPAPVAPADTLKPLAGSDVTVFDLQQPFLYWTDFVYEGVARVRGRPAHSFMLYPPASKAELAAVVSGVRVFLDTQFQALMQAELLGPAGRLDKTITVIDFKKVGEQWLPKSIDVRNHQTRDKTRFTLTAAALDLDLLATTFTPAALAQPAPGVPADKVLKF